MVRLTGPGKIREFVIPSDGSPDTTISASLFNFDVDGDWVKPQHREWLNEFVVPQLGDPKVTVTLRGGSSRSGSDAHDLELSIRRVKNVERILRGAGPVAATIEASGTGKTDAAAKGENEKTDDEFFRAVRVQVDNSAHNLVPPVFTNEGVARGFDDTATPPWLMLPAGSSSRFMRINNAEGLTLVSSNVGVVRVSSAINFSGFDRPVVISQSSEIFRVIPGTLGDATITAVDRAGRVRARMAVSVLRNRTVRCAFHFVRNPNYGSSRPVSDAADFLDALNEIWGSQANVSFVEAAPARELTMTDNLGTRIDTDPKFDAVTRHRRPGIQFNVFFVRRLEEGTTGETVLGPPGDCVFEDPVDIGDDNRKRALAHEAGHCLTLDHNTPTVTTSFMLMHDKFEEGRMEEALITRAQVLQARRAVFG